MSAAPSKSIVIVGGGLSGALVAAHLLMQARTPVRVSVVDASDRLGEGVAFHTRHPEHFLNVRAKSMSAVAGEPEHLLRWLEGPGAAAAARWNAAADPESFLPRGLYAEYIGAVVESARAGAARGAVLERIGGDAVAVEPHAGGARVVLNGGRALDGDAAVLALGNAPPAHPTERDDPFYRSDRYVRDPWSDRALDGIGANAPVFVAGTGLTMVDVTIALSRAGHRGSIIAVSRHGLVAQEHRDTPTAPEFFDISRPPATIRAIVHAVRQQVSRSARDGSDWRSTLDALRPHVSRLWLSLSSAEQRRFLRHVRPYWDAHRHRTAPVNMRDIERLLASGQLVVRAGRIRGFQESGTMVEVTFLPRGGSQVETIRAERVINATGPGADLRKIGSPLVDQLFQQGLARSGPHAYGFDATPDGVLLDSAGNPTRILHTLGPPLRGVLWETLAVPEIREQAGALAARLLAT